jgi:hypothetical protein
MDYFNANSKDKTFIELIQSQTYQNFGTFISKVFECKRDETNTPFTLDVATRLASDLAIAVNKKDASVFIRIFSTLSYAQYISLNEAYKTKNIRKDLSKFGGDFQAVLMARTEEKFYYLCTRLMKDKDGIVR